MSRAAVLRCLMSICASEAPLGSGPTLASGRLASLAFAVQKPTQARQWHTSASPLPNALRETAGPSLRLRQSSSCGWAVVHGRGMSMSPADIDRAVEEVNNLFVEARDEIEFATEDSETTYFDESVQDAKKVVDDCLDRWQSLLSKLPEAEAAKLQRSMGLKMEQLKAEFEILRRTHLD
mmetsp:Transcript_35585/g.105171  ORF Transcript_35585/g.105171 Transcript_35585/m.105171 type:complete len:179 (-) Transcript_35585:233-769(-)